MALRRGPDAGIAAAFEWILEVRDSSLVRTVVRDVRSGKVQGDATEYRILSDLVSHDRAALTDKRLDAEARKSGPVVRAVGRPGADAVEILYVGPD